MYGKSLRLEVRTCLYVNVLAYGMHAMTQETRADCRESRPERGEQKIWLELGIFVRHQAWRQQKAQEPDAKRLPHFLAHFARTATLAGARLLAMSLMR